MPLDKEALKQLAETLSQGMLGNIEHNSTHNDEVDEQDFQRSLQVKPPEVGEGGGTDPESGPGARFLLTSSQGVRLGAPPRAGDKSLPQPPQVGTKSLLWFEGQRVDPGDPRWEKRILEHLAAEARELQARAAEARELRTDQEANAWFRRHFGQDSYKKTREDVLRFVQWKLGDLVGSELARAVGFAI